MATTAAGVIVPAGTDEFNPQGDMSTMGASLAGRIIVPVANTTAQAAYISALTAAGTPPSASNPVYTHRADAGLGRELEVTIDGTTYRRVGSSSSWATYTPVLTGTGTSPTLGAGSIAGRFTSDGVTQRGSVLIAFGSGMTAGSGQYYITLPLVTPSTARVVGTTFLYHASPATRAVCATQVITTTQVYLSPHGATDEVGGAVPWTWASGDLIRVQFEAEVS